MLVVGDDFTVAGTSIDGDIVGFLAIGDAYATDEGTAIFAVEHQGAAGAAVDVTVADGAAHYVGGQCAAVIDIVGEDGILHCQVPDGTGGVAE